MSAEIPSCESCGAPATVRLLRDGSEWCRACDARARLWGYDDALAFPIASAS